MDIDQSKYFDTPDRERSHAALRQCPHMKTGLYFGLFLLGGFPLLLLFTLGYPQVWYLRKSVENGRPCCIFPNRRPLLTLRRKPDGMGSEPVWTWTEHLPPPGPDAWDSEEKRQTAEFLMDTFIPPALRPYVQPDTPLCLLLPLRDVFMFFGVMESGWRAVAKRYGFGVSTMNRIHRFLNASPYERRTFSELVSLILTLDRTERKNNNMGYLFCLVASPVYLMECVQVWYTGGGLLQPYISPWLGLVLFLLQYFWAWLWFAIRAE